MSIVILDACRNNPLARNSRSQGRGLATMNAPAGTLIAYATAPGSVALDGTGANGLYTSRLLEAMRVPGLKIEDVFKRVRAEVQDATSAQQVPWEASSLTGDFFFRLIPAGRPPGGAGGVLRALGRHGEVTPRGLSCTGFRLPTEAEWEYAARAGTTSVLYTGGLTIRRDIFPPELDEIAWCPGNSRVVCRGGYPEFPSNDFSDSAILCGPHRVGQKAPNAWGLYDMIGNVLEWCQDWVGPYAKGSVTDPMGPATGSSRVLRGGSFYFDAARCRSASRAYGQPSPREFSHGLRLARSVP